MSSTYTGLRMSSGLFWSLSLAVATLSGCYSPYGYQSPYGPGYYGQPGSPLPGNPGTPTYTLPGGQPLAPGGTYIPGTTTPGTSPTPLNAPGSPNTYDNGTGGINWNNAPTFNPNPGGSKGNVPDPGDDLNNSSPGASKPTLTPTSNNQDELQSPFNQTGNVAPVIQPAQAISEPDPFEMPEQVRSSATADTATLQTVSFEQASATKLNPYGRDMKHPNPTWLRGVVELDQKARTWSIIYSDKPDQRDANGGCVTLANHPTLARCRSGDVVLVEGAIDASQTDARGKPIYAVDNITPLTAQ